MGRRGGSVSGLVWRKLWQIDWTKWWISVAKLPVTMSLACFSYGQQSSAVPRTVSPYLSLVSRLSSLVCLSVCLSVALWHSAPANKLLATHLQLDMFCMSVSSAAARRQHDDDDDDEYDDATRVLLLLLLLLSVTAASRPNGHTATRSTPVAFRDVSRASICMEKRWAYVWRRREEGGAELQKLGGSRAVQG